MTAQQTGNRGSRRHPRPLGAASPASTVTGRRALQKLAEQVVAHLDEAAQDVQSLRLLRQGVDRGLADAIARRGRGRRG